MHGCLVGICLCITGGPGTPGGQKSVLDSLRWVMDDCFSQCLYWELNQGPLEEQPVP